MARSAWLIAMVAATKLGYADRINPDNTPWDQQDPASAERSATPGAPHGHRPTDQPTNDVVEPPPDAVEVVA